MKNILSVDVEDWFHILELRKTPDVNEWNHLESRVKVNFHKLLDTFEHFNTKVTCFFLGWVAERFPELVKEAKKRGHEVASHGYAHQLIYTQNRKQFAKDITQAKWLLEDMTGQAVIGYRAPGFSIVRRTMWALDELVKAGYKYDSSIFPASRGHGGIIDAKVHPHAITTKCGVIFEFPISVTTIVKKRICFFGGGYLRLFPYFVIQLMSKRINRGNRPVIYYIHPREIDPSHPRLPMSYKRRFKSYINLHTTMPKLLKLLTDQRLTSFQDWLAENEGMGY